MHRHPPTLPFELYRPIMSHIHDRRTLLALCHASPALRAEADRVIYAHPDLYSRVPSSATVSGISSDPQALLLREIVQNERHALLVQRLQITLRIPATLMQSDYMFFNHSAGEWEQPGVAETRLFDALAPPLEALIHLKHLVLAISPETPHAIRPSIRSSFTGWSGRTYGRIFANALFQLHSLVCAFQPDVEFISFLYGQKELRYLEWNPPQDIFLPEQAFEALVPPPELDDPTILPQISILSSNTSLVRNALSAGRYLKALQMELGSLVQMCRPRGGGVVAQSVASVLKCVEILSVTTPQNALIVGGVFSPELAKFFPAVRKLECTIGEPDQEDILLHALDSLPSLSLLKLHNTFTNAWYRDPELIAFVQRIFENTEQEEWRPHPSYPGDWIVAGVSAGPLSSINVNLPTGGIEGSVAGSLVEGAAKEAKITMQGWMFTREGVLRGQLWKPERKEEGWHEWTWMDTIKE